MHGAPSSEVAAGASATSAPPASVEPRVRLAPANATPAELRYRARSDPASLGSLSLGRPNDGILQNGVQLADGESWQVVYPDNAWATAETLFYLTRALHVLHERFPDAPAEHVGDLSAPWGGPLPPHKSHQSGRDVDVGYPRRDERWWANATPESLDLPRTWCLIRALVTETDVEVLFVDRSLQPVIRTHALASGEPSAWVRGLFDLDGARAPLIRHEPEHQNHLHVRFYNPVAQARGRVVHDLLAQGIPRPPEAPVPARRLPPPP